MSTCTSTYRICIEGLLRDSDRVTALTPGTARILFENKYHYEAALVCKGALFKAEKAWDGLREQMGSATDVATRARCAKAWLDAHREVRAFERIGSLLRKVLEQAAVATSATHSVEARRLACQVVASIGQGALLLVYYASEMAGGMILDGYGPATYQAGIDAMTATFGVGFMSALADAARAVLSVSALLRSKAGVRQLSGPTYSIQAVSLELDGVVATAASTVGRYTQSVAQALRLVILTSGITNDPPVTTSIPAVVLAGAEELASSQLLAAAAACLTDCPPPPANSTVPNSTFLRNHMFYNMRSACSFTVQAMWCMMRVQGTMTSQCGIEGQRLAAGLMRATRHEAVERLRMGLLDQLAAHAGMGAQLQQQQQGEEEHEQEGQQQGACWVGRSGAWWFANEEAGCGKLLGMDPKGGRGSREEGKRSRSRTAGWLEDYHCHIVYVTLVDWRYAVCDEPALAVAAGLPASPPPLLLARLVARAAEALCRLCRGQGLGGAYAPAPEWELAMSQSLVLALLPLGGMEGLPEATARACLPHVLEAAGWAVALMVEATAAGMGRRPSTEPPGYQRSLLQASLMAKGSQAGNLFELAKALRKLIEAHTAVSIHGFETLTPAARADVGCRMFRCGLAASLDHTLRLLYSAQEDGQSGFAYGLRGASVFLTPAVDTGLAPVLPPMPPTGHGQGKGKGRSQGQGQGQGRGEGGASAAGTGAADGGPQDQLGLLLTLSKRAAMLTRALQAGAAGGAASGAASGQGGAQGREQVMARAAELLEMMRASVVRVVEGDVEEQVAAARQGAEGGGADGSAWEADAVSVNAAHEALAVAVRAACNLAAPLALELAADLAAAAAAGASAAVLLDAQMTATNGVRNTMLFATHCFRFPLLLPPTQLLACQPHRLLAGACALLAALPPGDEQQGVRYSLGQRIAHLLGAAASHKTLSGRVRAWLAPRSQGPAASGSSSRCGGEEEQHDPCAGCLVAPVLSAVRHTLGHVHAVFAMYALALHKIAAGEIQPRAGVSCCAGGHDATGEADGGFQQCAEAMAAAVWRVTAGVDARPDDNSVVLPDGSRCSDLFADYVCRLPDGNGQVPPPPPPSAPSGPLPLPLVLPPSRGGVLTRLRMCGNPVCGNFTGESEGVLPLKQCGGCRAVRYCGADCQRAHWREGHKAECKALAAVVGGK